MIKIKLLSIFFVVLTVAIFGQNKKSEHPFPEKLQCNTCHYCEIPTKEDPCLYDCPREQMVTTHQPPEAGPDILVLNEMEKESDLYTPVTFSHKAHAEMSEMSGGCESCHHYNPPGAIISCKNCHEVERKRTDVSKPDLKGAYHRQCMDCHRAWSGNIECEACHLTHAQVEKGMEPLKVEAAKQRIHPEIKAPDKKVYNTEFSDGPVVTFFHNEHTEIFGLDCAECHTHQSCVDCHNLKPKKMETKLFDESHEPCAGCHNVDENCDYCHKEKEMKPFDHQARTGFNLSNYHADLSCSRCHTKSGKFTGLKGECSTCHSKWTQENFNHKITGLSLDETHLMFECENCHSDGYKAKPSCDACHDDLTYPEYKPGKLVKK